MSAARRKQQQQQHDDDGPRHRAPQAQAAGTEEKPLETFAITRESLF